MGLGGVAAALSTRAGFMANKSDPTKRKVNQDRGVMIRKVGGVDDIDIFGVLDGHGDNGHLASEAVKSQLEKFFENVDVKKVMSEPEATLKTAIEQSVEMLRSVHESFKKKDKQQQLKFDVGTSGTTACLTLRIKSKLYTANVGDSRAVLIRKKNGKLFAVPLSRDHKPEDPEERERIITAGGRCAKLGPKQPMRVLPRYADFPGLAVTRSVGDFWGEGIGLKAIPEFKQQELSREDLFVVWASDGIWEWLSNELVGRLVKASITDLDQAGKLLVDKARQMWDKNTDGSYHDDITCVIARFD